jgi:hypothetical protein
MSKNLMNTLESEIPKTNNISIFPDVLFPSWELAYPSIPIGERRREELWEKDMG